MINNNEIFKGLEISKFNCVGTPEQLNEFIHEINLGKHKIKAKRFCFDLDNTLVTYPKIFNDYSTFEPKLSNIKALKNLKQEKLIRQKDVAIKILKTAKHKMES